MLYPEIYEESRKAISDGNPELAEFADWLHLKSNLLGYFPQSLKDSKKLLDWIMYTNYVVHPTAILASFITILSSLTARVVFTETGCSTSLFTIAIAPTGSGKDIVTDIPRLIFKFVNRENAVIIQSKIFSEGALDDIFRENNIVVQVIDEFGDQLGQMLSDKNGHLKALMQKYKTLYSSTNGIYESARYSNSGSVKITKIPFTKEKPAFILTGITTKKQLFKHLKEDMLSDGFLNRFIIMNGSEMNPWTTQTLVNKEIPKDIQSHLSSFIATIYGFKKTDYTDGTAPNKEDFLVLKMSSDAKNYYDSHIGNAYTENSDIYALCKNDQTGIMQEISVRWRENALRLATAITAYELEAHVTLETLQWCYTFVKTMSLEFLKTFENEANKSKYEEQKEKAILWFKMHSGNTNTLHEISTLPQSARVFKNLSRAERMALIDDLVDQGILKKTADDKFVEFCN